MIIDGRHTYRPQAIGRVFGWFFLATFLTSIPAFFIGYAKMLDNPSLITGTGADPSTGIATGAALEVLLIVSNVATAVVAYPVLKRESEMGAIGYVAARLCRGDVHRHRDRQRPRVPADAAGRHGDLYSGLSVASSMRSYYRAFLVGPGFFAGLANGVILGYLMYRSELVPRGMTWLGLIGGPLVMITGILVMFDVIERRGAVQSFATFARGPLGAVAQHLLHRQGVQSFFPALQHGRR